MLKKRLMLCAVLLASTMSTASAASGGVLEDLHKMVCSWMMSHGGSCGGVEP